MNYDKNNIFAKILRDEIPCDKIYEDDFAIAFHDINPQASIHVLVIPKGEYVSISDFTAFAPNELIAGFFKAVGTVSKQLELHDKGYRILANIGDDGGQEVPHLHVHIFGGKQLGRMLS